MARLSKAELNDRVVAAVASAGWVVTQLSDAGEHPLRFDMERGNVKRRVRAYIWNTTHGGGSKRPTEERRIQITSGIKAFEPEPDGTTLILGWNAETDAFAAFDINHHLDALGQSPSIQIGAKALHEAVEKGAALHVKRKGEFAVALRPDLLAPYIGNIAAAHQGDLAAVTNKADGAVDYDFEALGAASRADLLGTEAELAERQGLLERLEALEREIQALKPEPGAIGHNQPPEPIDEESAAITAEVQEIAADLSGRMREERPDPQEVARQASRLKGLNDEAKRLLDKTVEKGREKMAETIAGVVVGAAVLLGHEIMHALGMVLHQLSAWFHAIAG